MAHPDYWRHAVDTVHGSAFPFVSTDVLYFAVGGSLAGITLRGVFREPGQELELEGVGVAVQSTSPMLDLQADELDVALGKTGYRPVARKDYVEVDGKRYVIFNINEDGEGIFALTLHRTGEEP